MKSVLLGLGSNLSFSGNDSVELLANASGELSRIMHSPVFSSVYESRPMYVENQETFFNMAVKGFVEDSENPYTLLKKIHLIEQKYGRDRSKEIRFGPRSLDIDIEDFCGLSIDNPPELILPHPRLFERGFVLIPSLEILIDSADEKLRAKFKDYASALSFQDVKKCSEKIQEQFKSCLNAFSGGIVWNRIK